MIWVQAYAILWVVVNAYVSLKSMREPEEKKHKEYEDNIENLLNLISMTPLSNSIIAGILLAVALFAISFDTVGLLLTHNYVVFRDWEATVFAIIVVSYFVSVVKDMFYLIKTAKVFQSDATNDEIMNYLRNNRPKRNLFTYTAMFGKTLAAVKLTLFTVFQN